jgi:predicted lipid-binding transport protein (Tim44 family)
MADRTIVPWRAPGSCAKIVWHARHAYVCTAAPFLRPDLMEAPMDFSVDRLPVDIVLFALVAGFLVLRLRSILGRRVGLEAAPQPPAGVVDRAPPIIEGKAKAAAAATPLEIPAPETRVGQILAQIGRQERGFDPASFLRGAESAFRTIVQAYAAGNRTVLRDNLTADAYAAFDGAVTAREAAGESQRTEIRAINGLSILDAVLREGGQASIEVRITSDQVSLVLDKNGQPVSGADAVTEFSDLWVFERLLGAQISGASWRLSSARTA